MKMRNSQRSWLGLLILTFCLLLVGARISCASELVYLALQREGQASVAIDERKKAAYVIDLGRGGDGNQVMLANLPLLDRLEQLGIEDLFFVCSHPHSDHMGGIRALFKQPRLFFKDEQMTAPRVKSITIIDDGVPNNLFLLLKRSLGNNALIKVRHSSATNRNAFTGLTAKTDDVYMETVPYPVAAKAGPHGRAVVTYIQLAQKNTIVDFDDADSAAIKKAVEMLRARGETSITAFVVPHHGSSYHDVEPILSLNPKHAIIAVNPENRYGHPSPRILLKLMQQLGKENVVFTGSVENVTLNPDGIESALFTAADRDSYAMFVAQNRVRAEKKGNTEDIEATAAIQRMMFDDGGDSQSSGGRQLDTPPPSLGPGQGGSARKLFEEEVRLKGSILQPDFELGAVSYGSDSIATLQRNKIFVYPLASSTDLTGQDVAVILERAVTDSPSPQTQGKLSRSEARSVVQNLKLLGHNADQAKTVYVYFSSPTGLRDVLEPAVVTEPQELIKLSAAPTPSRVRPTAPRRLTRRRRVGNRELAGSPPRAITKESIPRGGMVYLKGDKLFPVGEATQLLGGSLDLCGTNFCVKTSEAEDSPATIYQLPFSPGPLLSEVWTRVFDRRIDSFYLSINPTKQFLRNLNNGMGQIPTDRLRFGVGLPGTGARTHEVVTAGDIDRTQIGQILWEADVAFKSASLGFDVLTGERGAFVDRQGTERQDAQAAIRGLAVPYRERWCRLYWTSGSQSIEVEQSSGTVGFKGDAVVARSEPMVMRNGELVDEPRGTWCSETKSVAASLQQQANSGPSSPPILQQLKQLAQIQSFIRWARDNGITPTDAFRQSINQYNSTPVYEVPSWTSGIKSDPRVQVQPRRSVSGSRYSNFVRVSLADDAESTVANCVLPYWNAQDSEFQAQGMYKRNGVWMIPPDKYQFVDDWMAALASKIAACSNGDLLQPLSGRRYEAVGSSQSAETEFGIDLNVQAIHMHGGVLLGVQQGFLDAAREKGLLLGLNRKPLFQSANGKIHFWNYTDKHPRFGLFGQHVVIDGGKVTEASARDGHLTFVIETGPGAIALQESRWERARNFERGLEWAGARHASDGSSIWKKAAWPCAGSVAASPNCVQVKEVTLDNLNAMIGAQGSADSTIMLAQVEENVWSVDMNISHLSSELDRRWKEIPSSDLNSRLSLIYEYAKWGFIREALGRYREVAAQIEGDTVDTILSRQLMVLPEEN